MEAVTLKTMITQSKKLQKLVDCSLAIAKYRAKLQALTEEIDQILADVGAAEEQGSDFTKQL
jgi:hypothetical protein